VRFHLAERDAYYAALAAGGAGASVFTCREACQRQTTAAKARPYRTMAKRYRLRKPKYMELYSQKPPSMAPNRFADRAAEMLPCCLISLENAKPEKNSGSVTNPVASTLATSGGRPANAAPE